ncbi:glycosyltransferase family 4 protein [Cyclobacterium plantarum]|uniref:glycosyltransferase family 4 protein n=1 Tax=Cyclobacterium plantarum TaxID=2716263 RepID=UPI003F71602D
MKVLIICFSHFDATISLGKYLTKLYPNIVVEYIFILSRENLNVEILDLHDYGSENGFIPQKDIPDLISKEILEYISPVQLRIFIFNSIKLFDYKNYHLLFQLKKEVDNNNYDVLNFVGNNPWLVLLNYLIKNKPKIHTIHEPYPFLKHSDYHLLKFKTFIKLALHSSNHVVVPSKVSFNRIQQHYKLSSDRVSIIPFGALEIYKNFLKKKIIKENHTVLFYGNITKYKGIDILISAIEKIVRSSTKINFIIAGAGEFNHDISGIKSNVKVINRHLSNEEIAELNELATIVVCPYSSASQSGVVMTSFAFDNPIIATNVGALPEMIEDNVTGLIIEPENSEVLYQALLNLFNRPEKIIELRNNVHIRNHNSENSWSSISNKTFLLYQSVINNKLVK